MELVLTDFREKFACNSTSYMKSPLYSSNQQAAQWVESGKLKVRNGYASDFPLCARAPPFSERMRPPLRANTHEPHRFPDGCNMNTNAEFSVNRAELRAGRRTCERRLEPNP